MTYWLTPQVQVSQRATANLAHLIYQNHLQQPPIQVSREGVKLAYSHHQRGENTSDTIDEDIERHKKGIIVRHNINEYRIHGLFGGDFNLTVWIGSLNLNHAILTLTHKMN